MVLALSKLVVINIRGTPPGLFFIFCQVSSCVINSVTAWLKGQSWPLLAGFSFSGKKFSSFPFPGDIENPSVLLNNPDAVPSTARAKLKKKASKKAS